MPIPPVLIVYGTDDKPLAGSIPVQDIEVDGLTGSEIHEFLHQIYIIKKAPLYALLYGTDEVRKHDPLRIVKPVNKLSVPLYQYLVRGRFIPKVEIRWFQYAPAIKTTEEYFRMTLEHVRVHSQRLILPDVKDVAFERYDHLEELLFAYQRITWLYLKGHLLFMDEWKGSYSEEDQADFSGNENQEDDTAEAEQLIEPFKILFKTATFVEPKDGYDFDKKVTVQFKSEINRKADKVNDRHAYAKLYAKYKGNVEDLRQIQEGTLLEDGTWKTEFTLRKPSSYEKDAQRASDATVEYYAEIENKYAAEKLRSESITVPSEPFDGLILYSPDKNEYWEITDATSVDLVVEEALLMNEFAQKIQTAWQKPVYEEQARSGAELEKEFYELIGNKSLAEGERVMSELLAVKTNKRWGKLGSIVYIRNHTQNRAGKEKTIKGHWRKHSKAYVEKQLQKFLKLDEKSSKPEANVKMRFWNKDFDDRSAFKFVPVDPETGEPQKDLLKDSDYWSLGAEAQLLRFAAGASLEADITKIAKGTLKIGGQGNLTLSLAEGTVNGAFHLPGKNGGNILSAFTSSEKLTELVKAGRECHVRFSIKLDAYTFVGASVTAIIGLPNIDFSLNPKTGSRNKVAQVGAEAQAGASLTGGGTLAGVLSWKGHDTVDFKDLSAVQGRAEGSLGIAGSLKANIEYAQGKFRVVLAAGAVLGIGGKLGVEVMLGADEGYRFVAYILYSFDYHYVMEIAGNVFEAVIRMSVAGITEVAEVAQETALKGKELVLSAFNWGRQRGIDIKKEMVKAINAEMRELALRYSVPESTAAVLLGIMETPEEDDFDAILTILRPTGLHELKAILRNLSEMKLNRNAHDYTEMQGKALREGVRRLMEFGRGRLRGYDLYNVNIRAILNEKGIS